MEEVITTTKHLPHVLMLVVPLAIFAGIFALEWGRDDERPARPPGRRPSLLVLLMAAAALGSTAVHVAVVPEHFAAAVTLGWFFVVLSALQVGYVLVLLVLPVRKVVVAGVLGHLAVVVLWAWTRTVGVPFGLGPVDRVGPVDLLATGFEVACVLLGLAVVYQATVSVPAERVPSQHRNNSRRSILAPNA